MTYADALAFWYGRINYEQREPQPGDLRLDRMRKLLRRLGDPHERLRVLHVAGSKGKGSTAAMLDAVLRAAGYRVGLFTSPHLCDVRERFQVDGQAISKEELTTLLYEVRDAVIQAPVLQATFFELATAVGLLHFVRRRVDCAVLEVGLGGRFDSTNVCRPLVALLTSISFDHTRQLGNRLASIAFEKAGIIKPGRPALSGATAPEAREVIEQVCRQRKAPLRQIDVDYRFSYEPGHVTAEHTQRPRVQVFTDRRAWPTMELNLLGRHQAANAALVVACVEQLRAGGWSIDDRAVATGLAQVAWPARLEVLNRRPMIVLDCAHNVASADALVETLISSFRSKQRWLVFAVSDDKDVAGMLRILAPHFAHAFLTRYTNNPRCAPPEKVADLLRQESQLSYSVHASVCEAWKAARSRTGPEDLLCITGSVFLAGELRPLLKPSEASRVA